MEVHKFNWRILKTLSNCAFVLVIVIQVLDFYDSFWLDESMIGTPSGRLWLSRQHLYEKIGIVAIALMLIFRISYWTVEYIQDRRRVIAHKGD